MITKRVTFTMPKTRLKPWQSRPRGRSALTAALAGALSLSLLLAAPAVGDPVNPGVTHDEGHADEGVPLTPDSLELTQEELVPATGITEPLAIEGVMPDLEDLPAKFLQGAPAQDVTTLKGTTQGLPAQEQPASHPSPPSKSLPRTLDATPGWQATYSCDPNNKPGMVAFANLVSKHYNRPRYYTSRTCRQGDNSQHYEGRAVDWSMDAYDASDRAIGDSVATWLTKNNGEMARRFGIMSVIWNKRSWYVSVPDRWYDYTGPSPHTDHLHISFTWDGAMKRTSWWTGSAVTTTDKGTCRVYSLQYAPRYTGRRTAECPTSLPKAPTTSFPVLLPTARTADVARAQAHLGFQGADVDGSFGPGTLSRLMSYQRSRGLPVTGVLDNATWHDFFTGVHRTFGADRYGTGAALSAFTRPGSEVWITTGQAYPDALAASARAGTRNAPVLLVEKGRIPATTVAELRRLKPSRIFVIGGTAAISSSVSSALGSYTRGSVTRLSGADRYGTAGEVAKQSGTSVPVAYVATGEHWHDALVGAARAGQGNAPLLLTKRTSLPTTTRRALQRLNPGRIVVVGNDRNVSANVAKALRTYTRSNTVQRVEGSNAYYMAAELAGYYPSGLNVVYVTTAKQYPDALSSAARAGRLNGPVLLTSPTAIPRATKAALADLRPDRIVVVGGPNAVSGDVVRALRAYAR